jgi:hypothetical protein
MTREQQRKLDIAAYALKKGMINWFEYLAIARSLK